MPPDRVLAAPLTRAADPAALRRQRHGRLCRARHADVGHRAGDPHPWSARFSCRRLLPAEPAGRPVRPHLHRRAPCRPAPTPVVIQEDTEANGRPDHRSSRGRARPAATSAPPASISGRAISAWAAGTFLSPAATGAGRGDGLPVACQWCAGPRVAILATGDEIVFPGEPIAASQIVASTSTALAGFVRAHGGEPVLLGVAHDTVASLREAALPRRATPTCAGDHRRRQRRRPRSGADGADTRTASTVDFWKIAMRPGKPLMVGTLRARAKCLGCRETRYLRMVCAQAICSCGPCSCSRSRAVAGGIPHTEPSCTAGRESARSNGTHARTICAPAWMPTAPGRAILPGRTAPC